MNVETKLLLGAAREDITPKIGSRIFGYSPTQYSESVRDGLTATVLVFQSGDTRTMMITVTVCEVDAKLMLGLRREIGEKCGLSAENILIAATHTHSGPACWRRRKRPARACSRSRWAWARGRAWSASTAAS